MWQNKLFYTVKYSKEIARVSTSNLNFLSLRTIFFSNVRQAEENFTVERPLSSHEEIENNTDRFGSLAEKLGKRFEAPSFVDVPDLLLKDDEDTILSCLNQGAKNSVHDPYWYMSQCRNYAKQGKIYECVQMLVHKMLKVDRVPPKDYNFAVVIGALGRVGHAEKAFEIYNQMSTYIRNPQLGNYTGLFNAVANSSNPDHLKLAKKLYEKLRPNKNLLNSTVYGAVLKAYARHSKDHLDCFMIFQDMLKAGKVPTHVHFNELMTVYGKNRETGFLFALQVWRQMVALGIKPSPESLTIILRICYQCGVGDSTVASKSLLGENSSQWLQQSSGFLEKDFRNVYWQKGQESRPRETKALKDKETEKEVLFLNDVLHEELISAGHLESSETDDVKAVVTEAKEKLIEIPNFLNEEGESAALLQHNHVLANLPGELESLGACKTQWDRLQLIGGQKAILDIISKEKMKPKTQLYLWLAKCCQPDFESEYQLLEFYCRKQNRVSVDVRFFNVMMERRAARGDFEGAEQIFRYLKRYKLKPDLYTFKIKAMLVNNKHMMKQFLQDFCQVEGNQLGLQPNVEVYNHLFARVFKMSKRLLKSYDDCYSLNFELLKEIMENMLANKVNANRWTLLLLERACQFPPNYQRWTKHENRLERELKEFKIFYNDWLKQQKMKVLEDPMKKYEQPTKTQSS